MIISNAHPDPDEQIEKVSLTLKTLSHSARLQILLCLGRHGRLNGTALQQQLQLPQAGLSHHLIKMTDRGILQRHRKGKEIYYSLAHPQLIRILKRLLAIQSDASGMNDGLPSSSVQSFK